MAGISSIKEFFIVIGNFLGLNGPLDIFLMLVDISIISFIVYKVIQLVRETRAMQLVKGILFIVIGLKVAQLIGLKTMAYILEGAIPLLGFSLIVLFQPELRRGLEKLATAVSVVSFCLMKMPISFAPLRQLRILSNAASTFPKNISAHL